jgi:tRNA A-37 threonylcarbamoyl transferase component Bud32
MQYINPKWQRVLEKNGIDHYESLWLFNQDQWFEEPNHRRGGWSGVCKAPLILDDGNQINIFIKRQENHFYRSKHHFFLNRPTFEREYKNISQFKKMGIPTLDLIYFGIKKVNEKYQCILATKELDDYQSVELLSLPLLKKEIRRIILDSIAEAMRKMHMHGYQHGSLYPKHIFVKYLPHQEAETCFIDLEKTRKRFFKKATSINDLSTLNRHLNHVSRTDRLRFFLIYRQEEKLSRESKKMLKTILRKKRK